MFQEFKQEMMIMNKGDLVEKVAKDCG